VIDSLSLNDALPISHEHRTGRAGLESVIVERDRALIRDAVGADRDPRIARARIVGAVRGVAAGAARERRLRDAPREPPVERVAGAQPARAAVGPSVLLPRADQMQRILRVDGDVRLDFPARIHGSGRRHAVAAVGERAPAGDAHPRIADACLRRAHRNAERAVAFGPVTAGNHRVTRREVGRVAMIRINALVPYAVDGLRPAGARAGGGVGERDVELGGRLLDVPGVSRIRAHLLAHDVAFVG
jgi:hypothetical protein